MSPSRLIPAGLSLWPFRPTQADRSTPEDTKDHVEPRKQQQQKDTVGPAQDNDWVYVRSLSPFVSELQSWLEDEWSFKRGSLHHTESIIWFILSHKMKDSESRVETLMREK